MAFTITTDDGEVILTPINNQLRISTYKGDEPGTTRLTAEDAHTLGSALLAFAARNKA